MEFVNQQQMEVILSDGMDLFVNEVFDFFEQYMDQINPNDFFEKLIYDPDVQIPILNVMLNPELKKDIVVKTYEALRNAVNKKRVKHQY